MNCPKCQSTSYIKNGLANNRQRYLCKICKDTHTVPERGKSKEIRKMALILYLEGLGFRSIERILKVSHVSVMNWVRRYGEELEELKCDKRLDVIEMDEMHIYIASKKTIVGYGLLLTDLENDLSTAFLVQGGKKQGKNYGIKSRTKRSGK